MRSQIVLAIISITVLFSCSDDAEKVSITDFSLNIVDAQSVAVIENPIGGRVSEIPNNLYKLTTDGSFETVKFVNVDGTDIDPNKTETCIEVEKIFDLNSTYLLLIGNFTVLNEGSEQFYHYAGLLVRKQDGAIFDFDRYSYNFDLRSKRPGENVFKYDALGNIYFPTYNWTNGNSGVSKLIVDNPDELNLIDYLPTGQKAVYFDIALNGSCIYNQSYHPEEYRIKKPSGGVFEVQIDNRYESGFWVGANGSIYFVSQNNQVPMIHKINFTDDGEVSIDTVWSTESPDFSAVTNTTYSYRMYRDNSVVFVYLNGADNSGAGFEFFEDTNTVVSISLPVIDVESKIVNSKDFYYIASGTDLYKVSFDTHEYVKLLKTGEYEVYSLNVDDNDTVLFSGLRFKDGKMIFAEIDSEGNLTVVDEELDRKATMLQRLN